MSSSLSLGRSAWYDVCCPLSFPFLIYVSRKNILLFPQALSRMRLLLFFSHLFQSLLVSHEHRWRWTKSSGSSETLWAARE